ncbi:hypothetical protein GQ54DRAFT_140170 [Martensiomyces pterosporus]|nr:hypothetical protein GQ54DRAFT_140170 [Martensiomyces pterosporus]
MPAWSCYCFCSSSARALDCKDREELSTWLPHSSRGKTRREDPRRSRWTGAAAAAGRRRPGAAAGEAAGSSPVGEEAAGGIPAGGIPAGGIPAGAEGGIQSPGRRQEGEEEHSRSRAEGGIRECCTSQTWLLQRLKEE